MNALDLQSTFVGWDGAGGTTLLPVGPDFWRTIETNPLMRSTMISAYRFEADWSGWEMHPKGDELVVLTSGAMTMILETGGGASRVALKPGEAVIVPRGAWHTADVEEPACALFITFGEGTEHRPR